MHVVFLKVATSLRDARRIRIRVGRGKTRDVRIIVMIMRQNDNIDPRELLEVNNNERRWG